MKNWYSITAAAGKPPSISIFDEIGTYGITAAAFQKEFATLRGNVINLEINSPGGSVFEGIAIYNMLKGSGKTINGKVMGVAASIASVILMACQKITMPANAYLMVHSPMGGTFGTADEMREYADVLDKISASLIGTYIKRTGRTEADIKAMLVTDTWMTAAEAKANGFCDVVIDAVDATASFDTSKLPRAVASVFRPLVGDLRSADFTANIYARRGVRRLNSSTTGV